MLMMIYELLQYSKTITKNIKQHLIYIHMWWHMSNYFINNVQEIYFVVSVHLKGIWLQGLCLHRKHLSSLCVRARSVCSPSFIFSSSMFEELISQQCSFAQRKRILFKYWYIVDAKHLATWRICSYRILHKDTIVKETNAHKITLACI